MRKVIVTSNKKAIPKKSGMAFLCAPGRALSLGGEAKVPSPLQTRQGELLATGKGVEGDLESEESRSKTRARRTETTYEAATADKGA